MALATRCPYCNTTFRVTHDQLKLRGGLVRCGACKEIFNGVEHLLAAQTVPATGIAESAATRSASASASASATPVTTPPASVAPASAAPAPVAPAPATPEPTAPTGTPAPTTPSSSPFASPDSPAPAESLAPDTRSSATWSPTAEPPLPPADAGAQPSALDGAQSEPDAAPAEQRPEADATNQSAASPMPEHDTRAAWPATNTASALPPTTPEQDLDPLTRMTLMDMRPWPQSDTGLPSTTQAPTDGGHATRATDEIERALGELQDKPWRGSAHAAAQDEVDEIDALDNEEPDFVRQARMQAHRQRRTRLLLALGSVVLALLALLQAAIVMRTEIAARWPATLPALSSLCNLAGCRIGLPQQIEYVTIESHELQALPNSENGFLLSTLLRNRSKVAQAWPYLELTLNDPAEQPVVRRVLTPADYLPAAERARGMAPSSERPLRITFTLSQLKASGYRLYVFYP